MGDSDDQSGRGVMEGACFTMHGNSRVFAKAIMALNRVGEELYLEPNEEGLALRALNSSKSAYATFLFSTTFFVSCNVAPINADQYNLCRISMKCALSAFRGVRSTDKQVLSCRMYINPRADSMLVQLTHTYDVINSHEIPYLDCTTAFRNIVNKADLVDCIVASSITISSLFSQMRHDSDEVMLCAKGDSFMMRNFTSRELEPDKMMKTEVKVGVVEFERYNVPKATEVTVNLKEFKALVSFAEAYQASVSLYFDHPGSPMVIALESDVNFTAELVVATVDADNSMIEPNCPLESRDSQETSSRSMRGKRRMSPPVKPTRDYSVPSADPEDYLPLTPPPQPDANGDTNDLNQHRRSSQVAMDEDPIEDVSPVKEERGECPNDDMNSSEVLGLSRSRSTTTNGTTRPPSSTRASSTGIIETARTSAFSLRTPPRVTRSRQKSVGLRNEDIDGDVRGDEESGRATAGQNETAENSDEEVFPESPSPPPSKAYRRFFLGCSQRTLHASQMFVDNPPIVENTQPINHPL